ncbi:Alpha/beta hydrolase fold-1 [Phyllosticta citrichinensis]|uniref:Alpha/beta hydrolase fold-1 n=1 Tax=Phyllosticta citrichinensis TaxID=1130410 RepID=A0ABR1XX38_9PEZI
MSSKKPVIVFAPAAWHGPDCFEPTIDLLSKAGYTCVSCNLPSLGAEPPLESWDPDVAAIRKTVKEVIDTGRDAVVIFHSYSGLPGGEAMKGLDRTSRAQAGLKGAVVRLVYLAAFFAETGMALIDYLGGQDLPWFDVQVSRAPKVRPRNAQEVFYNDLSPVDADKWAAKIPHHCYRTFYSRVTYPAFKNVPSTYLICEADNAIPLEAQESMLEKVGQGRFDVERCGAGHSPFLSMPRLTSEVIRRAAGEVILNGDMRNDSVNL